MRIYFLGLSSFLVENEAGFRVLIDPYNDAAEWSLGPKFPTMLNGKPLGANIVLMSEPDADHAYAPGDFLSKAPKTKPDSNPFPGFDLRGTVIYEYNGDVNIAWHYTIDDIRIAHFADNAHLLQPWQLRELWHPDIVFMSPPKVEMNNLDSLNILRDNIASLNPKLIVWAHHVVPDDLPESESSSILRPFFQRYFYENARTNQNYRNNDSFIELCYVLENAYSLNREYNGTVVDQNWIEIRPSFLEKQNGKPTSILFRKMLTK